MRRKNFFYLAVTTLFVSAMAFGWYAATGKYRISKTGNVKEWSWYRCDGSPEGKTLAWVDEHCQPIRSTGNVGTQRPHDSRGTAAKKQTSASQDYSETAPSPKHQKSRPTPQSDFGRGKGTPQEPVVFAPDANGTIQAHKLRDTGRSSSYNRHD